MATILMHKNTPVLLMDLDAKGNILDIKEYLSPSKMPTGVKCDTDALRGWWKNHSIPVERDSIRRGLECIGLSSTEELKLLSHGISLTNHYWIKEEDETLTWEDVNFWENPFSEAIGEALFNHKPIHSPLHQIGNSPDPVENGALKKRWIVINHVYYIQKGGKGLLAEEVFNELLASSLFDCIKTPHARYDLKIENGTPTCISECITDKNTELVPISQIFESVERRLYPKESEYEHFQNLLEHYGVQNYEKKMQDRLAIGYILADTDMHYNNLALLKKRDTFSLAPFYDLGTSLYAGVPTKSIDVLSDGIVARPFCNKSTLGYWSEQRELIQSYPDLSVLDFKTCIFQYIDTVLKYSEYPKERIILLANAPMMRAYNLQRMLIQKGVGMKNDNLITKDMADAFLAEIEDHISFMQEKNSVITQEWLPKM